jgi:mono/diheme cytochrome c family protein
MRRLVLLLPLVLLCTACLSGTVTTPTPSEKASGYTAPKPVEGNAEAGKAVFASAGCASCHALADANAKGSLGPDLDASKPELELIVERVKNGKAPMPSFKDSLTDTQIADVAAYVYASTH